MSIVSHTLKNDNYEQLCVEIRYLVASARATDGELVSFRLNFNEENISKASFTVVKILRALKKEGKIDFFASGEDFLRGSAEASYLINKFPNIIRDFDANGVTYIIKL